jgi:choline kinase
MGPIEGPKALLPLGTSPVHSNLSDGMGENPSFFSRHVEMIGRTGIRKIFVVARRESQTAFTSDARVQVEVVTSRFSEFQVGSSLSLLCGLEAAQAWGGVGTRALIMDADIVYERALLDAVAESCDRSRLFTIERAAGDTEEVRVYGHSPDKPVLIGKGLSPTLISDLVLLGESLGIIYLAAAEVSYCTHLIRWLAGEPPEVKGFGFSGLLSEHEEVWQYFFSLGRLDTERLPASLLFSECDSPDDYAYIRKDLFPAILERDRKRTQPAEL